MVGLCFCARALVAASGAHSSSRCAGLSLSRPLLLQSTSSRRAGSVVVAHGPSCSTACGILPARARTRVPCTGRQILNHCATREAHPEVFHSYFLFEHPTMAHTFHLSVIISLVSFTSRISTRFCFKTSTCCGIIPTNADLYTA